MYLLDFWLGYNPGPMQEATLVGAAATFVVAIQAVAAGFWWHMLGALGTLLMLYALSFFPA
ncbi:hypothetical protein [Methylobacterium nodulans]|uniref:Uncharacterized protein n=1 Tax=Methylobacterium nodulans (strain LMG 21967 / CNCM I-2342 / ORS 2060) TaxID=460265 RepID=B8II92_METNO|nr:hypothetical protein [Methylobacterium nodulans]ACL57961.1 hypothetical protein Mnod_3018 [Methylobacterium nodulans ORS 2060]